MCICGGKPGTTNALLKLELGIQLASCSNSPVSTACPRSHTLLFTWGLTLELRPSCLTRKHSYLVSRLSGLESFSHMGPFVLLFLSGNLTAKESRSRSRKRLKNLSGMSQPLLGLQQRVEVTRWGLMYLWLTLPLLPTSVQLEPPVWFVFCP